MNKESKILILLRDILVPASLYTLIILTLKMNNNGFPSSILIHLMRYTGIILFLIGLIVVVTLRLKRYFRGIFFNFIALGITEAIMSFVLKS